MHYEINVAHKGSHLFATAPRSVVNEGDLYRVLTFIRKKFPEDEGFSIGIQRVETTSVEIYCSLDVLD